MIFLLQKIIITWFGMIILETLERLITFHNDNNNEDNSKGIVCAHNTHIGDARTTDMSKDNMINLG